MFKLWSAAVNSRLRMLNVNKKMKKKTRSNSCASLLRWKNHSFLLLFLTISTEAIHGKWSISCSDNHNIINSFFVSKRLFFYLIRPVLLITMLQHLIDLFHPNGYGYDIIFIFQANKRIPTGTVCVRLPRRKVIHHKKN